MFLHELNETQRAAFICLAHDVVVSDGELSPGEAAMMQSLKREIDLAPDFEPHYIPVEGIEDIFDTRKSRVATMIALIRLSYADGAFEIEEQFLLKEICAAFKINTEDFARLENWVQRLMSLEKEAQGLF